MRPIKNIKGKAKAKGGRASGGTRYFQGKISGEEKMINLMQKALNKKKQGGSKSEPDKETVDSLISKLELSCSNTKRILQETKEKILQGKF